MVIKICGGSVLIGYLLGVIWLLRELIRAPLMDEEGNYIDEKNKAEPQ